MSRVPDPTATPKPLQIRVLGPLEVARDGAILPLPASKKTRALLGYLVASRRPHLREQLCNLLWEGPDDPRAALRWSLTKLRPLLDDADPTGGAGGRRLHADRERVAFELAGAEVDLDRVAALEPERARLGQTDVATLATLPTLAALEAAVACFRGPFLDGLDLPGAHRYHAWCVAQRAELHAAHVALLTSLVERLAGARAPDSERALHHARALVTLDPLAEASHVMLVRLLSARGRSREALVAYEHGRSVLARELGRQPSRELEELRMSLTRAAPGPAAPAAADPAAPSRAAVLRPTVAPEGELPLVGRDDERARLAALRQEVRAGRSRQLLLLLGDAGIGKTRLLEELRRDVRADGGDVLSGRAFEAEMVRPYGPWLDALGPAPFAGGSAAPGDDDRGRLFEAVRADLAARARQAGVVLLVLDDVQWLDESSAALLHFTARALEGAPVLIACAARAGELSDNAAALRTMRALERDDRLLEVRLPPLPSAATAALAMALAGGGAGPDAARVVAESEGNPLYAIEIARALAGRDEARSVPPTLQALIAARLDRLDDRSRPLVALAAALGRSFDPDTLARVSGLPAAELLAALDLLERHDILRASGAGAYDFAHDLTRRAAYQQMPESRRRLVHLQIARTLADLPDADGALAGDLAHHAALGGDAALAARAYLTAGRRALRLFAWTEAAELALRGRHQLDRLPAPVALPLHRALLEVTVLAKPDPRDLAKVDAEIVEVIRGLEAAGLHAELADGFYLRAILQWRAERYDAAAEATFRQEAAARMAGAATRARSLAVTGRCLVQLERDVPRAQAMLEEARQLVAADGASDTVALALGCGLLHAFRGERAAAEAWLERGIALAVDKQAWEEFECWRALVTLALEEGRLDDARRRLPGLLACAARMGEGSERPTAAALAAVTAALAGEPGADAALAAALAALRAVDAKAMLATTLDFAAELALAAGHPAAARAYAEEALAAATAVDRRSVMAIARAALAHAALATGDVQSAAAHLAATDPDHRTPLALRAHAEQRLAAAHVALAETISPPP